MNKERCRQVILVSKCCSKGYSQALTLIKELKLIGLDYNMSSIKPKQSTAILDRFGITVEQANKTPYIFIEDNLFTAESINNKKFIEDLVGQIAKINHIEPKWTDKIVFKSTLLFK